MSGSRPTGDIAGLAYSITSSACANNVRIKV
jgi:hypothetical protein